MSILYGLLLFGTSLFNRVSAIDVPDCGILIGLIHSFFINKRIILYKIASLLHYTKKKR